MFYTTLKSMILSFILLMSITSSSYADFYVIPVVKEVPADWPELGVGEFDKLAFTDNIQFDSHFVGDLFRLSNGEIWQVKGAPGYYTSANVTEFYYTFNSLPEPEFGIKTNYYFWDGKRIYYVAPLN